MRAPGHFPPLPTRARRSDFYYRSTPVFLRKRLQRVVEGALVEPGRVRIQDAGARAEYGSCRRTYSRRRRSFAERDVPRAAAPGSGAVPYSPGKSRGSRPGRRPGPAARRHESCSRQVAESRLGCDDATVIFTAKTPDPSAVAARRAPGRGARTRCQRGRRREHRRSARRELEHFWRPEARIKIEDEEARAARSCHCGRRRDRVHAARDPAMCHGAWGRADRARGVKTEVCEVVIQLNSVLKRTYDYPRPHPARDRPVSRLGAQASFFSSSRP